MKKFLPALYIVFIAVVLGTALFYAVPKIPARSVEWENNSPTPLKSISEFFKNIFVSSSMTMLVLGVQGPEYGKSILTDSIIVVHFDPTKSKVFLISIPRDLWISDNKEQFKINEMLAKRKVDVAANKIEEITGLSVDGYVVVDLAIVKDVVDYFGGIDITLNQPAVDWVSGYTMGVGDHHLNGEDAVWIIRNRFNPEGDFFREKNQHQILESLFEKFKALSRSDKLAFIERFAFKSGLLNNADIDVSKATSYVFNTDLPKIKLESIVLDFNTKLVKTDYVPVNFGTTTKDISILLPIEGFEKYSAIQNYIKDKITN